MAHRCPAPNCPIEVPSSSFACREHWFSIPRPLRNELWAAYKAQGALSKEWIAAANACETFLRDGAQAS